MSSERSRSTESSRGTTGDIDSFAWALLHAIPDGIVMVDDGGRIIFANRRAETLFGYARGELLGESVEILVPSDRHDAHREHRSRYSDAPNVRPMGAGLRLAGVRRDGTRFPVDVSLSPLVEGSRRLIVAAIRPHSDAERDRLATDLLDTAIHRLFSIGLSLQAAAAAPEDLLRQRVSDVVDTLDQTIHEIRTTLFDRLHLRETGEASSPSS